MATKRKFCGWEDHKTTKNVFGFDKNYMNDYMYNIGLIRAIDDAPQVPVSSALSIFGKHVQDKLYYLRKTLSPHVMIAGGHPASCLGHKEQFNDIDVFCCVYKSSVQEFEEWCDWFHARYECDMLRGEENLDLGEYIGWYNRGISQKETHYSRWLKRGKERYFKVVTLQRNGMCATVQIILWYIYEGDWTYKKFLRPYVGQRDVKDEIAARYRYFIHHVLSGFDIGSCREAFLLDPNEELQEGKRQHFKMLRLGYIPSQPLTYMGEYAFSPCKIEQLKYVRALEYESGQAKFGLTA